MQTLNNLEDQAIQDNLEILATQKTKYGNFVLARNQKSKQAHYIYSLSRFTDDLAFDFDLLSHCTDMAKSAFKAMLETNKITVEQVDTKENFYEKLT